MVDIDILEQKPITMVELKNKLSSVKKEKGELNFRANKVHDYLLEFAGKKNVGEICKKLADLGILKLRERHITKIIDVMPKDIDSLKTIFIGETVSLKQEEAQKIIAALND